MISDGASIDKSSKQYKLVGHAVKFDSIQMGKGSFATIRW